ncbi:MAG: DNA recombination protein RmuC [Candidatus Omnitrophica bacterium]|nr:DNA recombination protein RmuC [Candidatus Omnitrophota bacterium]
MLWLIAGLSFIFFFVIIFIVLRISSQVNERLNQMTQALQEANKIISQNLNTAAFTFGNIKEELGRVKQTNNQILEISKDISRLQELLRAPKFRGEMGEMLLENLLSRILPKDYYRIQYRFKSQETVDAVIKLGERLVPVDAKFSLENFQKFQEAKEEQSKNAFRKKFIQDIKMRIDEIASKYILPAEDTYDFALMYIPAENVYYEIVITEDLFSYFMAKKVIPVSPNTFYAYLQVICLGLKGLKIEENAKVILKNLNTLSVEMDKFKEEFELLGAHLSNATKKYDDTAKRLEKFSTKLLNIQEAKQIEEGGNELIE